MFSIMYTELLKIKRRRILLLAPVCSLATVLFGYVRWLNARQEYGSYNVGWDYLFPMIEQASTNGLLLIFVVCFSAFIFLNEYKNNCENIFYAYPQKSYKFVISKLLISYIVCLLSIFVTYIMTLILGGFTLHEFPNGYILLYHIRLLFILAALSFSMAPLFIIIAVLSRGYTIPMSLITVILVLSLNLPALATQNLKHNGLLPWNVPGVIIQSLQPYLNPAYKLVRINNYTPYILSVTITFILPLIILVLYFTKSEYARTN